MNREAKKALAERRKAALLQLTALLGLDVAEYNGGRHLRIFGKQAIDYWPATGAWWITGSDNKSRRDPEDLFDLLRANESSPEESAALNHMKEICA